MVGKKLRLRLQKSNAHDRGHGCMNENNKDGLMVMRGWEPVLCPGWAG